MSVLNFGSFQFPSTNLNEELANIALNHIDEGVMITDRENKIVYINKKFEQTTGYTFEEIKGKTPKALQSGIQDFSFYEKMKEVVDKTGKWKGELWNRTKNGKVYLQTLSILALKDSKGNIQNFIGIFSDLFKNKLGENEPFQSMTSYYDTLTDLPNRIIFEKRSLATLKDAEQNNNSFAIVYFRIENFTHIRDKHGSLFSDILLKRISTNFMKHLPGNSLITRWNESDFAAILERVENEEQIKKFVQLLNNKITAPITVNGIENHLTASFGISVFKKDGSTISELLANAYIARKYASKEQNTYKFCHKNMDMTNNFFVMEFELKRAIEQEQFELYYQPLIDVEKKKLNGFETLVRWNHPTAGIIPPLKFIPLAEQTGLIVDIGNFVFRQACKQLAVWRGQGHTDITLSVNISMTQFQDEHIVDYIAKTLKETGVPPEQMVLELTESSLSANKDDTITKLHQLKTLGLGIAIDDFGTGYSSLGYIIDFPVDKLKIDRSFIKVLGKNKKIEAIVSAIKTMAHTMDIAVIAEGIETKTQFNIVEKLNCNTVQGFLFDKPIPFDQAEEKWLKNKEIGISL